MTFDDLRAGISVDNAVAAMLDGCNRRETLFAPENWRRPRIQALKKLLSDPLTQSQAAALRSAVLKRSRSIQ